MEQYESGMIKGGFKVIWARHKCESSLFLLNIFLKYPLISLFFKPLLKAFVSIMIIENIIIIDW